MKTSSVSELLALRRRVAELDAQLGELLRAAEAPPPAVVQNHVEPITESAAPVSPAPRTGRLCGICRRPGHRRETCPFKDLAEQQRPSGTEAPRCSGCGDTPCEGPPCEGQWNDPRRLETLGMAPPPTRGVARTPAQVLPAARAAYQRGELDAVYQLAAEALVGDYILLVVHHVFGTDTTGGAKVLLRTLLIRSGALGEGDEDALGEGDEDALGEGDEDALGEGDEDALGEGDEDALGEGDEDALGEVLLIGGIGRMLPLYRLEARRRGLHLVYIEKADTAGSARLTGRSAGRLRAVLVFTAVCSHPLRQAAQMAAKAAGCPCLYLNGSASVLKLRAALAGIVPKAFPAGEGKPVSP